MITITRYYIASPCKPNENFESPPASKSRICWQMSIEGKSDGSLHADFTPKCLSLCTKCWQSQRWHTTESYTLKAWRWWSSKQLKTIGPPEEINLVRAKSVIDLRNRIVIDIDGASYECSMSTYYLYFMCMHPSWCWCMRESNFILRRPHARMSLEHWRVTGSCIVIVVCGFSLSLSKRVIHAIEPLGRQSMKSREHWCHSNRTLSTSSRFVFLNHCNPSVNQIIKATQNLCKTSSGLQSWTVLGALPLAQPCLNFDIRGQLPVLV